MSRVRVSVRPSIFFIREKLPKSLGNRVARASVYFNESPIGHCLASVGKGAPKHDGIKVGCTETAEVVCGGVHVREYARTYVRDVFAKYDDNPG